MEFELDYSKPLLDQVYKQLILKTLEMCDGDRKEVEKMIGIAPRTLRTKIALYEIDTAVFKPDYDKIVDRRRMLRRYPDE